MLTFLGSLANLQDIVMRCAISGEWSFHKKSRFYRFRAATGAILNWWPTTGTINFQGQDAEQFKALFLSHAFMDTSVGTMPPSLRSRSGHPFRVLRHRWMDGTRPRVRSRQKAAGRLPSRAPKPLKSSAIKLLAGLGQD
jgi:hypothetical protein